MNCSKCGRSVVDGSARCTTCFAEMRSPLAGPATSPSPPASQAIHPAPGGYPPQYRGIPPARYSRSAYGRSQSDTNTALIITLSVLAVFGVVVVGLVFRFLAARPAASGSSAYVNVPPPATFAAIPQSKTAPFIRSQIRTGPMGPASGNQVLGQQQDALNRMNQQMEQQRQWAQQMQQQNMERMQQMQNQTQQNMQAMRERSQQNIQNMQNRTQQLQEQNEEHMQGMTDNSQQSMQRIRGIMRPGPGYGGLGF